MSGNSGGETPSIPSWCVYLAVAMVLVSLGRALWVRYRDEPISEEVFVDVLEELIVSNEPLSVILYRRNIDEDRWFRAARLLSGQEAMRKRLVGRLSRSMNQHSGRERQRPAE